MIPMQYVAITDDASDAPVRRKAVLRLLISSYLTSSQLTSFHLNRVGHATTQCAVAVTNQNTLHKLRMTCTSFWSVAATENWIDSQCTQFRWNEVSIDAVRWDQMRWVIRTLLQAYSGLTLGYKLPATTHNLAFCFHHSRLDVTKLEDPTTLGNFAGELCHSITCDMSVLAT